MWAATKWMVKFVMSAVGTAVSVFAAAVVVGMVTCAAYAGFTSGWNVVVRVMGGIIR